MSLFGSLAALVHSMWILTPFLSFHCVNAGDSSAIERFVSVDVRMHKVLAEKDTNTKQKHAERKNNCDDCGGVKHFMYFWPCKGSNFYKIDPWKRKT